MLVLFIVILILGLYNVFELVLKNGRGSTYLEKNKEIDYSNSEVFDDEDNDLYEEIYPYKKKYLLSSTEYRFYKILKEKCDAAGLLICPKVRMEDFLTITDLKNKNKYRNRIKSRHIDFIICNADLYMLAGLELDDNSHSNERALDSDHLKDNVFRTIGVPLYRIAVGPNFYAERIDEMLADLLD